MPQHKSVKNSKFIFVVDPILNDRNQRGQQENLSSEQRDGKNHTRILEVFFMFAYCLCISPFYIGKDLHGTNHVAKRWVIQMVLCFIVTLSSLFTRFTDVRKAFPYGDQKWNPVVYFRIFYTICSLGLSLNAWWSLWRRSDRFTQVVQFIESKKTLPYLNTKVPLTDLVGLTCFIYAGLGFASALLGSDLMESQYWTPFYWVRCLVQESRYQLFTGTPSNCSVAELELMEEIFATDYLMASFTAFGQLFKYITLFYFELFILLGVLSLWLPAASFANALQDGKDKEEDEDQISEEAEDERILKAAAQWPFLEEQYLSLKDLSDLLNNAFGAMVFSYTSTSIFYYSINLDAFLLTPDVLVRIRLIVLYLGAVVMYILAADICRQVGHLEVWLSEYADDESKSTVPFHRLTVILNELSTNTIGITGWDVFTITYSVVANITSVLITYFIICVQFRKSIK